MGKKKPGVENPFKQAQKKLDEARRGIEKVTQGSTARENQKRLEDSMRMSGIDWMRKYGTKEEIAKYQASMQHDLRQVGKDPFWRQFLPHDAKVAIDQAIADKKYSESYKRLLADYLAAMKGLDYYMGDGTSYYDKRLLACNTLPAFTNATATQVTLATSVADLLMSRMKSEPSSYDDSGPKDDWAKSFLDATRLCIELMSQNALKAICPSFATSDSTAKSPFTLSTWRSIAETCGALRIPPLSILVARILTSPICLMAAEPAQGTLGTYFLPVIFNKTADEVRSLIDTIATYDESTMFSEWVGVPNVPLTRAILERIHVVSYASDWAQFLLQNLPVVKRTAGPTYTLYDVEFHTASPSSVVWNQYVGTSVLWEAGALLRDTNNASVVTPGFITAQNPAADNKLSIYTVAHGTSGTAFVENYENYCSFIVMGASAKGQYCFGMYSSEGPSNVSKADSVSSTVWNGRLIRFLAEHADGKLFRINQIAKPLPDSYQSKSMVRVPSRMINVDQYGLAKRRA